MAFLQVEFFSHILKMAVTVDVIIPQPTKREIGIDSSNHNDDLCPVLWLLHGASDDHTTWQRRTSIERFVAPLGLAVVMPSAHLSSYTDMVHGGDFYTYVSKELPEIMRSFFPLSDKREDNFIAGNSMGGFGSMKIGLNNPQSYAAIGCFSAGANNAAIIKERMSDPRYRQRNFLTYGDKELTGTIDDVWFIAEKNMNLFELPRVFLSCGKEDFLLDISRRTAEFFKGLEGNPYDFVYEEHDGNHEWDYWDAHITDFLAYIMKK